MLDIRKGVFAQPKSLDGISKSNAAAGSGKVEARTFKHAAFSPLKQDRSGTVSGGRRLNRPEGGLRGFSRDKRASYRFIEPWGCKPKRIGNRALEEEVQRVAVITAAASLPSLANIEFALAPTERWTRDVWVESAELAFHEGKGFYHARIVAGHALGVEAVADEEFPNGGKTVVQRYPNI